MLCLAGLRLTRQGLQRWLVYAALAKEEAKPTDWQPFLHYAHTAALLDETADGYRFVHPLLQRAVARSAGY
jgi:NADH:ubiquinone oxidoreductase subunit